MPDPDRIAGEVTRLLQGKQYVSVLYNQNLFRNPTDGNGKPSPQASPALIGKEVGWRIFREHILLDPVQVVELRGPVEFYRVHDRRSHVVLPPKAPGKPPKLSSGTLSAYWSERGVVEEIWRATARWQDNERRKRFMEFMLSANFVLPEWNDATQIACMSVPPGATVVVVRGRGNWQAMQTTPQNPRPAGQPPIHTSKDVETHLRMMTLPGLMQCYVPLFVDEWIRPVHSDSRLWPLAS